MIALLGNGEEIRAMYKTLLKFMYKNWQFTVPCFVFPTLKFKVIIGTRYVHERQAIIVFETLLTDIRDDKGERVEFNNSIGELNHKVKAEYAVVLGENVTLYPMSTQTVTVFIIEKKNAKTETSVMILWKRNLCSVASFFVKIVDRKN